MKKNVAALTVGFATAMFATGASAQSDDKTIQMATMTWSDLTPITGISKQVLEEAGYDVDVTSFSEWGIAFAALSRGDVDILVSQLNYTAQDYWDRNKKNLEKLSPVSHGLSYGIVVPSYVTIDSLDELAENADRFNGEIVGIEPGAGLMRQTADAIEEYELPLRLVESSTPAMASTLEAAIDREEWIAATVWEPSWMMQAYDVKYLEDPKGVYPPPQTYYWIGRQGWAAENPKAREVLASVYVPLDDINEMNGELNDGSTMEEAVENWVEAKREVIDLWLNIDMGKYE